MATDSQNQPAEGVELPGEVVGDILSAPRRRTLLRCLADNGGELVVDDVAVALYRREQGAPTGEIDAGERQRLREEIYEEHLPRLTATDVVEYDSMRECIRLATPAILEHITE